MKLKEMNKEFQPREKAIKYGLDSLSDVELLAIILRTGTIGKNALQLASEIVEVLDGVGNINVTNIDLLKDIKGLGKHKLLHLKAILLMQERINKEKIYTLEYANNPDAIFDLYKHRLINEKQEHFIVLCLNSAKAIISEKLLFIGTLNNATIHPREIIKYLTSESAASFIMIHNHPSNHVLPSDSDIITTQKLEEIGQLIGIPLLDHIIIGLDDYYSFARDYKI